MPNAAPGSPSSPKEVDVQDAIAQYPSQAPSLHQTLADLTHAARWDHLHVLDLGPGASDSAAVGGGAAICGLRPEQRGLEVVWSCGIADRLNNQTFLDIFQAVDRLPAERAGQKLLKDHFLLAVLSPDATVVYYSIARGLVKPVN